MRRYTLHTIPVKSRVLEGNPLGDPTERSLFVVAPDGERGPLPVLWVLVGFAGTAAAAVAEDPWDEGLRQRLERLDREGVLPPCIAVVPDCFTALGGSQYLNSTATGRYEDHLWQELLPLVRERFPTGRHGILGKSSGGYGALVQAMRHPEVIEACACHSGDMAFDLVYRPDLPALCAAAEAHGGIDGFLEAFRKARKKRDGRFLSALNALCMAACYAPDPSKPHGVDLPVDLATCALRPDVWARWLAHDPLRLVEDPLHQERLRKLRLLFLDCGSRDEHGLQWGLRQLVQKLAASGVPHRYETFDDGHRGLSYRYDVSLPLLARALTG